jgi:hypothetical protein
MLCIGTALFESEAAEAAEGRRQKPQRAEVRSRRRQKAEVMYPPYGGLPCLFSYVAATLALPCFSPLLSPFSFQLLSRSVACVGGAAGEKIGAGRENISARGKKMAPHWEAPSAP